MKLWLKHFLLRTKSNIVKPSYGEVKLWLRILHLRFVKYRGVQLRYAELKLLIKAVDEKAGCCLLVFGLGNDSPMWQEINAGGRTVFLEDNDFWFNKFMSSEVAKEHDIEAYRLDYPCKMSDWESLLDQPEKLELKMPEAVADTEWDVILVDGPEGGITGRMSSIYMSSKLAKKGGFVFVHDCERQVEEAYADKYLKDERLVGETFGRSLLKKYAA